MVDSPSATQIGTATELPFDLPDQIPPHNEGNTVASWFAMICIMIGVAAAAVGFTIDQTWLLYVGGAITVVGLIAGWFLRVTGHGQPTN